LEARQIGLRFLLEEAVLETFIFSAPRPCQMWGQERRWEAQGQRQGWTKPDV